MNAVNVATLLALANAAGATAGSPYTKSQPIAQKVEGIVSAATNAQGQPTGGWRFTIKDDTGELSVSIHSGAYAAGKTTYDLHVAIAERDIFINGQQTPIRRKGDKVVRAY